MPGIDESAATDADIVRRAIEAMGELDLDAVRQLVDDEIVLELPFRSDGPTTLIGDDAHAFMRLLGRILDRLNFYDVVVHGPTRTGLVVAEYKSDGLTKRGRPYCNAYSAFFRVRDGRIMLWREYFNPLVVSSAFG